jgi:preprotein translocase subunit SecE
MSAIEQVKPTPVRSGGEGCGITSWWTNTRTFLTEVRNEMRRVTWPSRKEVYATTVVVILTSILFGVYLYGIDLMLNALMAWIFRTFGTA